MTQHLKEILGDFNNAKKQCAPVKNFFREVWTNLDENDHTRILLAILRTEVKLSDGEKTMLPFLIDFCKTFGIEVDVSSIIPDNIFFDRCFIDENATDSQKKKQPRNFIDGLVLKEKEFAVIIENKVCGATDQKLQLDRYIASCIKEIKPCNKTINIVQKGNEINKSKEVADETIDENIWAIYLTAIGGVPSNKSYNTSLLRYGDDNQPINTNIGDRLLCLSYKDNILPWLERIKHQLPGTMYNCVVSYIEYLKQMLQLDNAQLQDKVKEILKNASITNNGDTLDHRNLTKLYNDIQEEINKKSNNEQLQEADIQLIANCESLKNIVGNIKDDIERPYWDKFNEITRKCFKELLKNKIGENDIVIKKLTYNKDKGYIQIRGASWDNRVHYEWYQVSFEKIFFEKESPLTLCIHVEVKDFKEDFKEDFKVDKGKVEIEIKRDKSGSEMIKEGTFDGWLKAAYNEVLKNNTWGKLNDISNKIKSPSQKK